MPLFNNEYAESHFRVMVPPTAREAVQQLCRRFRAPLLLNPFSKLQPPLPTLTLRRFGNVSCSVEDTARLVERLERLGVRVGSINQEVSIYDSDIHMDRGWIHDGPDPKKMSVA